MFYKWQFSFIPSPVERKRISFCISRSDFTNIDTCLVNAALVKKEINFPYGWTGPFVQILQCPDDQVLHRIYNANRMGKLCYYREDVRILLCDDKDDTADILRDMTENDVIFSLSGKVLY